MTTTNDRETTFREALFSGDMDLDGMDALLAIYRDLYPLRQAGPGAEKKLKKPPDEEISMRLGEGFTLLELPDLLPPDTDLARPVERVGEILAAHSESPDSTARIVERLLEEPEGISALVDAYMNGGDGLLRKKALSLQGANPEVVTFLIFNALKGLFLSAGHAFSGTDKERWNHGRCPVCGGEPAVSYLAGEGGKRFLMCHRCEATWRFRRLVCPFCEHESPSESGYLYIEEPRYRMMSGQICRECSFYIKTWRVEDEELGALHPEVEDLKTPAFDAAMRSEGYGRGAPNIFGVLVNSAVPQGMAEKDGPSG